MYQNKSNALLCVVCHDSADPLRWYVEKAEIDVVSAAGKAHCDGNGAGGAAGQPSTVMKHIALLRAASSQLGMSA